MTGTIRFRRYDAPGAGAEMLAELGPEDGPRNILILPPLFDELNRMRRTIMLSMRALARSGIASALIDLPGQNESPLPLEDIRLNDWREAVAAAAREIDATHIVSFRGGALIDDAPGLPTWRYAPTSGKKIMNVMLRAQVTSDKQAGLNRTRDDYWAMAESQAIVLGGKTFSPGLVTDLRATEPAKDIDVTELDGLGPPLWLRVEPGESRELANAIADAIDSWSAEQRT